MADVAIDFEALRAKLPAAFPSEDLRLWLGFLPEATLAWFLRCGAIPVRARCLAGWRLSSEEVRRRALHLSLDRIGGDLPLDVLGLPVESWGVEMRRQIQDLILALEGPS